MYFNEFTGRPILITGASTGIGAALARALGGLGARVAVHYNSSQEAAEEVAEDIAKAGGEAFLVSGDVSSSEANDEIVARTVETFGGLHTLVNNAGGMLGRIPIADVSDEHYERVMDLNARSVLQACRAAIPAMRAGGGGNIINTTSIAARTGGGEGAGFYGASKAFVSTLTRVLAKEHAKENIRVNGVAPGVIATPFHERYSNANQLEGARKSIPMGRLGTSEDCVGAFLFLGSDALSGYITGQVIEVNGGQLMP
jgi:3-oxoacyl-[acyl-carrier protein] reductase